MVSKPLKLDLNSCDIATDCGAALYCQVRACVLVRYNVWKRAHQILTQGCYETFQQPRKTHISLNQSKLRTSIRGKNAYSLISLKILHKI